MKAGLIFRADIALSSDLELAVLELRALGAQEVVLIDTISELECLLPDDRLSLDSQHGLLRKAPPYGACIDIQETDTLTRIITRASFVQTIFSRSTKVDYSGEIKPFVSINGSGFTATTQMAVLECTSLAARQMSAKSNVEVFHDILNLLLLNKQQFQRSILDIPRKRSSGYLTHAIHYYKASFFPRMARAGINLCVGENYVDSQLVFDNFVGSGTTLLEASLMGMKSVGIDLDPVSVLISRIKQNVLQCEEYLLDSCKNIIESNIANGVESHDIINYPDWLTKNRKWAGYSKIVSENITLARRIISSANTEIERDILSIICSDGLTRNVQFRFMGTGSGRFSLDMKKTPFAKVISKSIAELQKQVSMFKIIEQVLSLSLAPSRVDIGDATQPLRKYAPSVVMTSPPYLPASSGRESYTKSRIFSHLAIRYLETEQIEKLGEKISGSMEGIGDESKLIPLAQETVNWVANDVSRSNKAPAIRRYFMDMNRSFAMLSDAMKQGAVGIYVSGKESVFYQNDEERTPVHICPSAEILAKIADENQLTVKQIIHLKLDKKGPNARPRSRDDFYESLIFFQSST